MNYIIDIAYEEIFSLEVESESLDSARQKVLEMVDMDAGVALLDQRLTVSHRDFSVARAHEKPGCVSIPSETLGEPPITYEIARMDSDVLTIDVCGLDVTSVDIHGSVFDEELSDYLVSDRESRVVDLVHWLAEATGAGRDADFALMKEDLLYLWSCDDEFVLEAFATNGFIAKSKNPEKFNNICADLVALSREVSA